jgi:DNA-binding transcriptional ArsR family regulator
LFALASETRLKLLKALQGERRTLSQLAELLEVDKAAVHRHLKKLEEGGLVKKDDDHGFIYYSLTWKARDLISPGENTRIMVLLSSTIVLLVIFSVLILVASTGVPGVGDATGSNYTEANSLLSERVHEVQYAVYAAAIVVIIVAVTAGYLFIGLIRPPRQSSPEKAEDWEPAGTKDEGQEAEQD